MKPLVTIGIPVYNVGRFIGLSLKSVLQQSYTNFELIITDDGSTDNTVEVIRSFNDPRITLIVDGENHGISYRLNQQIDLAKGKYFVRMDGDDLMFPDRVEKQVNYLEEHPDVDVVGAGAVVIDDDNNIIGLRQSTITVKKPEDIVNKTPFIHPTVCGKISFFQQYHYDERLSGVEDNDLWLRGVANSRYEIIQFPLMFYRDPLKFKIKTYTRRKIMGIKKICIRWRLFQDKKPAIRYFFDALIKVVGSSVLYKLGKEDYFLYKRNSLSFDSLAYQKILNALTEQ